MVLDRTGKALEIVLGLQEDLDDSEDEDCKPTFFSSVDGVWGNASAYMELLTELCS